MQTEGLLADNDVQYESKDVRAIRGTEARTIAKWQKAGWEFVAQSQRPLLQSKLTFRRPKPKKPWRLLAVLGGGVLLLIVFAIVMGTIRSGGSNPAPTTPPTKSAVAPSKSPSAKPTTPAKEQTLTVENNQDLVALLSGPNQGPTIEDFAAKYKGRTIEFDGSIGAMAPHDGYKTRYDILISPGDYSETHSSGGPSFQLRDVNTTSDLHLTGDNIPDHIGVGDNIHIVAQVEEFEPDSLLFLLKPISTQFR